MAIRDQNFELNRNTHLRDIGINRIQTNRTYETGGRIYNQQRGGIQANLKSGLRDLGLDKQDALRSVVNNALQRGIFNSGIRKENQGRVNTRYNNAVSDLKGQSGRELEILKQNRVQDYTDKKAALDQLSNQENYWKNIKLEPLGGGGSNSASALASALENFMRALLEGMMPDPIMTPPSYQQGQGPG